MDITSLFSWAALNNLQNACLHVICYVTDHWWHVISATLESLHPWMQSQGWNTTLSWSDADYLFHSCHSFLARKWVKPTNQQAAAAVPGGASSLLLQVRHRTSGGSKPQSRVRQAEVNSRSSHGTDEAVSVCHALYSEDPKYYVIPAVTDTYIPQDNAVRWLFHRPIT